MDDSLELIPRSVRDKLDRVGIKLHLRQWQALSLHDRESLRDLPCESDAQVRHYAEILEDLIRRATGASADRIL